MKKTPNYLLATLAALLTGVSANAQDTRGTDQLEEIVVTGIRGSQQRSIALKRNAETTVDAISAEDIGQFPDQNLAESLQRIPGVSIDRDKGEGRNVSIRGLGPNFVQTTLNGRTIGSADTNPQLNSAGGGVSRAFSFDVFQSELVSALEVYKGSEANLVEGGIAGTLNIKTIRPLDLGERALTVKLDGTYDDFAENFGPRISALYSDVFSDGTIGLTIGGSYSNRELREDRADGIAWGTFDVDLDGDGTDDVLNAVIPNNLRPFQFSDERDRLNLSSTLQIQATDDVVLTFDAFYGDFDNGQVLNDLPTRLQVGGVVGGVFTDLEVNSNGTATSFTTEGAEPRIDQIVSDGNTKLTVLGGNLAWNVNGWDVEFDVGYSSSEYRENLYRTAFDGINQSQLVVTLLPGRLVPDMVVGQDLFAPDQFEATLAYNDTTEVDDEEIQFRLEGKYEIDEGFLRSISAGLRFADHEVTNDNNRVDGMPTFFGTLLSSVGTAPFPVDNFLPSLNATYPREWLITDFEAARNFFFVDGLSSLPPSAFKDNANQDFIVEEATTAFYTKLQFDSQGTIPVRGNLGLRVVMTDQSSSGVVREVVSVDQTAETVDFGPDTPNTEKQTYWDVLPSLNLMFDLNDEFIARVAVSSVVTRPGIRDLPPSTLGVNPSQLTLNEGNPNLDPFRAKQYDLGLEWYFDDDALASVGFFYKDVESFSFLNTSFEPVIVNGVPVINDRTGLPLQLNVSRPENGEGGEIWGFEATFLDTFDFLPAPFDGFGASLNYTFVDSNVEFISGATGDAFGIPGLSKDNMNATLFYERDKVSVRASYNYRSDFLQLLSGVGTNPEFVEDYGQLDFSARYDVNDRLSVQLEGINITNEVTERFAQIPERLRNYIENGRRYTIGVRYGF